MDNVKLLLGDCLDRMRELPDHSVDAIVTDPPYGLSFMGKKWDYDVPSVEIWAECLRVLKPGGHLLAFAGTRTQHRMAVRIEDAGFEIRDMIAWVYGSGFPKSHNLDGDRQGWGTALKPALEPITVARKPLIGTVAANVLAHGTGALNIDGCRIATHDVLSFGSRELGDGIKYGKCKPTTEGMQSPLGRWPANLIHDGSQMVLDLFPEANNASAARFFYCAKTSKKDRDEGLTTDPQAFVQFQTANGTSGKPSSLSEGRDTQYRNTHPTVKPTDLMRYLCRLITPPGGTVLDPFMGSGSTGKAAKREGFGFIGIERDPGYFDIAQARIGAQSQKAAE